MNRHPINKDSKLGEDADKTIDSVVAVMPGEHTEKSLNLSSESIRTRKLYT